MLIDYKRGQGSIVLRVKLLDSSVSTGAGKTGLTNASSGLKISTIADNEAAATVYTVAASNVEAITTLGTYAAPTAGKCRFKEVDATNHPGVYEIQIADARFGVSSAKSLLISISGAANAAETDALVPLRDVNLYDAVRAGLTALPNAAAEASGGLPTLSAAQASNGTINANVHRWLTGTPNALQAGRVDSYLGAVASAVIAAGSFAANALDAVWSTATRVLTAGTNIALAKGTGVTGFNDLDAAATRAAVGLAAANLDTQIGTLATASNLAIVAGYIDTEVAAIKAKTDALPASPAATSDVPTAGTIAAAVWNEAQAGHTTAGTFGKYVDASISGVSTGGVSAATIAAAVLNEALAGHTTAGTLGKAITDVLAAVDTEIAAIKAKTDNLPTDPADASDIAASFSSISATLATLAGYVDTEVAAIKAKTDNLTFDGSNRVAANVKAINDAALTGAGTNVAPWGPA